MQLILLKGQQGTGKTGVWGRAIADFFRQRGKDVCYLEAADHDSRSEFDSAMSSGSDVIIFETNLDAFPFHGVQPDFTITCQIHDLPTVDRFGQIILLKGEQGSLKTSIWGAAIAQFFRSRGKTVHYLDCVGPFQEEFDEALAAGCDVTIVDTFLDEFPFTGPQPDSTITCEIHDKHAIPVSHG